MGLLRTVVLGVAAGAVATVTKTKAEELLQPWSERVIPPAPAEKATIGGDVAGHPENMPPSELADRAVHAVTGGELTDEQRTRVSAPLHWAMGVGFAVGYAVVAARLPVIRTGRGLLAGAGLFAATHASTLPALGLQHPPTELPTAWWIWEGGSHLVYGTALDTTYTLLDRVAGRRG